MVESSGRRQDGHDLGADAAEPGALLAAAMDLADAEGISAITMRRLAADLGVEAMSLYHHVPGKERLLDGLAEAILAEINAA